MRSPKTISAQELASLLSGQAPLLVVDLRKPADYRLDPRMLPGAVKQDLPMSIPGGGRCRSIGRSTAIKANPSARRRLSGCAHMALRRGSSKAVSRLGGTPPCHWGGRSHEVGYTRAAEN
jgi:hypothetical protein